MSECVMKWQYSFVYGSENLVGISAPLSSNCSSGYSLYPTCVRMFLAILYGFSRFSWSDSKSHVVAYSHMVFSATALSKSPKTPHVISCFAVNLLISTLFTMNVKL